MMNSEFKHQENEELALPDAIVALYQGKKIYADYMDPNEYIALVESSIQGEKYALVNEHREKVLLDSGDFDCKWYVYQGPQVLTRKEKDFLKNLLIPYKKQRGLVIMKSFNPHTDCEHISILYGEHKDCRFILPEYPVGKYYKYMEANKAYSLIELDLEYLSK